MKNRDHLFKPGNEFWKQRSTIGAKQIMESPEKLYEACLEYFKYIEENPLQSEKVGFSKGRVQRAIVTHPRAMTIWGISCFLGIVSSTWYDWRKNREDLKPVIAWAEEVIREQKFSAAAAGLLNANIISRELGLADKQIVDVTAPRMTINPPEGEAPEEPPIYGE